jgi:hypothetical protein
LWTADARSYLIDTILLGFSTPKIYLRTKIDIKTQIVVRDVVDGRLRLRLILDFADNNLELSRHSGPLQSPLQPLAVETGGEIESVEGHVHP